jgi:Na+/H+-dicarboxylate symporter
MRKLKLTTWIVIGMALGIVVGHLCHQSLGTESTKSVSGYFSLVADLFLRLIKMIVAPLVLTTLVVGVAKMGDARAVGRIGFRTVVWFMCATFVLLLLGALVANWTQPGTGLNLPLPEAAAATGIKAGAINIREFVMHLIPKSIIQAMAENEILQIG